MAVLPTRKEVLKQFYMPSTAALPPEQQAWVKIDMAPMVTADLLEYQDEPNSEKRIAKMLLTRIKEWNYTEEDGTPIEVSFDGLIRMPAVDYQYLKLQPLGEAPKELSTEEKKS